MEVIFRSSLDEDRTLDSYYNHQVPPALPQFAAECTGLNYDQDLKELYVYHGTNCFRRWEINRSGFVEPGRNHYSFYCTSAHEAYTYARAACMRDLDPNGVNSLTCEPVVLKVKFTERTWLQVDFVAPTNPNDNAPIECLSLAVLGPIPTANIVEVLHCTHGKRLGSGTESVRTFADGSFIESIQKLKEKLQAKRLDSWLLKKLGGMKQKVSVKLAGGEVPELTSDDHLRKLRQNQIEA